MNDNGATFHVLSEEAQETLLRLQSRLILDRFSEEAAGELAALGYATRRSLLLSLTDAGMHAARRLSATITASTLLKTKPATLTKQAKRRIYRQERALRFRAG